MADTTKPADRSAEATVPDAPKRPVGRPPNPRVDPYPSEDDIHPPSRGPIERVQHADRAVPDGQTTNRQTPLSAKDRERFLELHSKEPNPNVLPPNVRTEDEEHEFRKLSKVVADAERQAALEASTPAARPNPRQRLEALKAKPQQSLGEGERIDLARTEELIRDEARIEELKKMDKRVEEEDAELAMLQKRATEARAAGGFDPNG